MLEQVKASAGSGKTYQLTHRFLDLLRKAGEFEIEPPCCLGGESESYGWPEILAITFTNKAAVEMKERVVTGLKMRALGRESRPDWSPAQAAHWLDRILRHYHQLNIRTIDSLMHMLLRIFAVDLGLPPDFQVVFDTRPVFDSLFDRFATRAREGSEKDSLPLRKAVEGLLHLENKPGFSLSKPLGERLRKVFALRLNDPRPLFTDEEALQGMLRESYARFREAAASLRRSMDEEGLKHQKNFSNLLEKVEDCLPFAEPPDSAYLRKEGLEECVLKASRKGVTPELEASFRELKAARRECVRSRAVLLKASSLAPFVSIADELREDFQAYQQLNGVVPAGQWNRSVRRVLEDGHCVNEAFCRLAVRLRHLLIDEFQDTSREQWETLLPLTLECLSRGGSVFYVGDVKQAIYGWRGGDARLFDEILEDPEARAIVPRARKETLPFNWRSLPGVVDFNNRVFHALSREETARRTASALLQEAPGEYVEKLAGVLGNFYGDAFQKPPADKKETGGWVTLRRLEAPNKTALQEEVRKTLEDLLKDLSSRRPWGDTAILVRANEEASLVARWCIEWDVPVVTENSLLLAEHPLVRQLTSMLAFLDYPLDDLAFWGFVQGEELFLSTAGLSAGRLCEWLVEQREPGLYRAFRRDFPDEWSRWVEAFHRRAGLMTPYDTVREIVEAYGLVRRYPRDELFLRRFLEVAHGAEELGCQSLSTFLELWKEKGGEERVPLPEHVDAVRIMTIHKAKGLEFPVVVVPFHHWGRSPEGELVPVQWPDGGEDRVLLAPLTKELERDYHEHCVRFATEDLNLLYVAWTRAVEELHGIITRTPHHERRSPLVRALDVLLDPLGWEEGKSFWETGGPSSKTSSPVSSAPTTVPDDPEPFAPPGDFTPMGWLPRLKIPAKSLGELRENLPSPQRLRGEMAHRVLECLQGKDLEEGGVPEARIQRAVRRVAAEFARHPFARRVEEEDLLDVARWVLSLPDFSRLLAKGVPECSVMDEKGKVRRMDLLAVEDGEAVVVEYKTGSPEPEHVRQIEIYLRLVRTAPLLARRDPPVSRVRGVLVYLDRKETVEVPCP